jgi:hypothetical protein
MKKIIELLTPYLIGAALLLGFVYSCNKAMKEARQTKGVENAVITVKKSIKTFTANDGRQAAKIDVMQLTTSVFKLITPELVKQARNVNVSPGSVQNATQIGTLTVQSETLKTKDSIILDTVHVKIFSYHDTWTDIKGIVSDSTKVKIESRDTLTTILYKGDRVHPWFWILSRRKLQQTIIGKNPHTKITFQQVVTIGN